jgi:lipid II:glycine glycyltransferase (peptidoglycan interpeptide bridge formation enzyme)
MNFFNPIRDIVPMSAPIVLNAKTIALNEFDLIQSEFDGIVQEMTVAFATSRWPNVKLEPWIYEEQGKAIAAALVMVQNLPLRSGKLAVVKWGPILRDENAENCGEIYASVIEHLANQYSKQRGMMLSVMARAEQDPPLQAEKTLRDQGFKPGSALLFPNRYVVKVRMADEIQRKSFSQKWRYHLSKSEKNGLIFEIAPTSDLKRFQSLYESMSDRKNFPDHSAYETLTSLYEMLPGCLRPQLFFVTKDGVDVAGAIIFTAGRTAVYLYGATNDMALPLRAGYYMHAKIISWLRDNTKTEWYDLGGTDGFHGLHQFKKGMVGSEGRITPVPPINNHAVSKRAYIAGNTAYLARDGLQTVRHRINKLRSKQAKPDQQREAEA